MKRRQFLNTSVLAGTAALVAPASVLATRTVKQQATSRDSAAAAAQSHARKWLAARLHTSFDIETPAGVVAAELMALNDCRASKGLDQFTAVFRVPRGSDVDGLRVVAHGADAFPLNFDRSEESGDSKLCQAPFSLLV